MRRLPHLLAALEQDKPVGELVADEVGTQRVCALGEVDPGKHRQARFTRVGRYTYVCEYHPGMHGTVVVRAR